MANNNKITTILSVFLIVGFLFFSIPMYANAGGGIPPANPGCCQSFGEGSFICSNSDFGACKLPIGFEFIGFFEGQSCNQNGLCSGFQPTSSVPTLSEWGLIAMAGVLGLVGFMVMRIRKAAA